jgi:tRNA-dihydrouridine synthase
MSSTSTDNTQSTTSLHGKVVLAPMVRGSELAFRQIVRRNGVQSCYSPMLRADEVVKAFQVWNNAVQNNNTQETTDEQAVTPSEETLQNPSEFDGGTVVQVPPGITHEDGMLVLTDILADPAPVVVQLCGNDPQVLQKATKGLLDLHYSERYSCFVEGVDINLGCPQKCALTGHFGAFLAEKNPEIAVACVAAMRATIDETHNTRKAQITSKQESSSSPSTLTLKSRPRLSCKIRLLDTDEQTIDFAKQLVDAGCELLAVHCRRRTDKSGGAPNLRSGRKLVQSLPDTIPVLINGAVMSINDVHETLSQTKAQGVMIATGFLGNPRLLTEPQADPAMLAAEYLESCQRYPPVTPLYIQKHLRWIFRPYLEPKDKKSSESFKDWRPRLWTFLVRPYLQTMDQFRAVVVLYVQLNKSEMPASLRDEPEPSFKSIRHHPSLCKDGKKRKIMQC